MGAAAFLMVEYVGISYVEVITHAFLPAAISYIALVYIVHLEAVKRNMPTLGNRVVSLGKTIGGMAIFFVGFAALCYGVQYPVGWVVAMVPAGAGWVMALLIFLAYMALLWLAAVLYLCRISPFPINWKASVMFVTSLIGRVCV